MTRRQISYWSRKFGQTGVHLVAEAQDVTMDPHDLKDIFYLEVVSVAGDRATCYSAEDCRRALAWRYRQWR